MKKPFIMSSIAIILSAVMSSAHATNPAIETKSLEELHKEALAEGGHLVVYAGGDTPTQQDATKDAFEKRFPGIKVDMIVDYSKYHNARIDYQLETKQLKPDFTMLQTLQDFPRWKKQGVLMDYKPAGWEAVYPSFKDKDGAYSGVFVEPVKKSV
ncbi:MAG: hypothetical protein ACRCV6_01630 [Formosimonas sp.]